MSEAGFRERLQAIINWADLAMKSREEFDSHGVRNLDGPVFDAARAALAKYPLPQMEVGEVEKISLLREALQRMENCCERLASTRTIEIYTAMIDGGQAQALLDLDNARRNARAALATEGKA